MLPMLLITSFVSFINRPSFKLSQSELFNSFLQLKKMLTKPSIDTVSVKKRMFRLLSNDKAKQKTLLTIADHKQRHIFFKALRLKRGVFKFLAPDRCLIHQSTLFLGKHHHAFPILYVTRSADCRSYRGSLRVKFNFVLFEAI